MRKFFKILLYIIGSILLLLILIVVFLQTPWGKSFVRKQAVSYLQNKLHTEVRIDAFDYSIPDKVSLGGVFIRDLKKDTLLNVDKLAINLDMWALVKGRISVDNILLEGVNANVYRNKPDTVFNYEFIVKAFAGNDTAQAAPDTAVSKPMDLNIGKVSLKKIRLIYNDETGGTYFSMNLGSLLLRIKKLDLDKMKFELNEFSVSQLQSYFATDTSYLPPPPKDTSAPADFRLIADKVHLDNIQFSFLGKQDSTFFGINLGSLNADIKQFGLLDQVADLNALQIEKVQSTLAFGKPKATIKTVVKEEIVDTSVAYHWKVNAGKVILNKIGFAYDDNAAPRMASGMDYSHLNIQGFSFNADRILYTSDTISGNVRHAALNEKSGLNIIEFRTDFLYCNQGAVLNNLYLLTPGTELQRLLDVKYPSIAAVQKDMNKLHLNIDVEKSKVSMKDVMLFLQPEQKKMLAAYSTQQFNIAAKLNGYLNALQIQNFAARGLHGTDILLNGRLNGLPDQNKLNYNLNILKLRSTYKDIEPFLTDSVKMLVNVPEWFMVNGHISGTMLDYSPNVKIQTSDGDATVDGTVMMSPGEGKEKYNVVFSTKELNIGKILRQDSVIGKVTIDGKADGTSFDVNKMNTTFAVNVQSLWSMGYNYNNIHLAGGIQDKVATVKGNSTDPNLDLTIDAFANLGNKYPSLFGDLNIENLDLQALNLYSDTMRFKGNLHADFESLNPDYPSGLLTVDNPILKMAGYKLSPDSIYIRSTPVADSQDIYMNIANVLHLNMNGRVPLTQTGNAFLAHVNEHYKISDSTFKAPENYAFSINVQAVYQPILRTWLPQLKRFDTIKLAAVVRPDTFSVYGFIPRLINGADRLDSGVVRIYEAGDTMKYSVSTKRIASGNYQLWYPRIGGSLRNDSIYARIVLNDSLGKNQFAIGAAMNKDLKNDTSFTYVRLFKGIILNYDRWDVNPANRLVFGADGFYVRDFVMNKGDESISANSQQPQFGSPFQLNIHNFSLSNLTRMISKDTLLADGKLDANVDMEFNRDSFPDIYAKATIRDLIAYNVPVGNLDLTASNSGPDFYNFLLKLTGNQNDLTLGGDYYLKPVDSNEFKIKLDAKALYLKSLEGLTFGAIKNSSGFIKGQLDIFGTTDRPKITGELQTDNLTTTISMLNTPYSMPSEKILFDNTGMTFNNFTIYDKAKNKLIIDGKVKTRSWSRFYLDLNVNANKWLAVNSTKKDYNLFYGKLLISSDLTVKGSATAPNVEGQLQIHDSTNITYAMLDEGPGVQASEGIVKFIDSRDTFTVDSSLIASRHNIRVSRSSQLNVNVDIEKNAVFNVVIDPVTGDNLQVKGEASLNTEIGPDGAVGLTGTYQLADGYYELHYNFIKKKFKIQSGSTIALSGDPMDAEVDITAVYESQIAPYELVEKQLSQDELNQFKQRLPFQILLKLKGKVLKPDISFDIVLPETTTNTASSSVTDQVQRKLTEIRNDPSTLNKQVFAALILGRFVADDPFASSGGGGLEYAARQSASRFLSDQLNNLAGQLVKGVELNVDLQSSEDYSTGTQQTRSDLSVSASKRLFSDRLNVTVGNDFQLEGPQAQSQQSSLIPGNLSADYQLTKDGKYMIRGYRVNQLQNIIDGYVIETGISFRVVLEYNKFKYIFRNRTKQRQRMQEQLDKEAAKKEETDNLANPKNEKTD
jgi:translocation and assembly module TamB